MISVAVYIKGEVEYYEKIKKEFSEKASDIQILDWSSALRGPDSIDYALVWMPPIGNLARLSSLKAVFSLSAGVDHIVARDPDWPAHLPLIRMAGEETGRLMTDYLLWACISVIRGSRGWALQQQKKLWKRNVITRSITDCTVGIMGLGQLGRYAAEHLSRCGFVVRGWSRSPKEIEGVKTFDGAAGMKAFLAGVDILICLLPHTPQTRNIISAQVLHALRPGAAFINVGRGEHVVENDLLSALNEGMLSAAVLDVFHHEPLPESSPLWSHPSVIVTPHVASQASVCARVNYLIGSIRRLERGERLEQAFDISQGY
ncbi:2-hydroxyacid dehydrogenase [Gluconobacter kanchanaburiensis]|uniref:Glyoxylate/hydroxypyruvate reductase A n=1 Tax=Gluconobacter kanchanaburiensis NBRC 103587 TaxID=1307948 RepID=A0A511BAD9_9PROT|nr:glyoxylate/hydroxypyruvate reductase A [Gluconobacter kanchanaburiensis]MBF0862991.1 glyoxylate/hydroxypyruvate reductase A [Gluconobacter kanchanaburiensis]GBR70384.1 D-isomer specific 2-hydroxyacid dehydrogenase [Gluconobacter kanchanaburiensis NBRC 103587]GEK97386.1 glyoxylate/hydroxypyruvate reductase A [Gluconobacter kanchanaburiensis NBRC 103587]